MPENIMTAPNATVPNGWLAHLQKVATVGTLVKTLLGFGLAIAGSAVAVHQYFAKTYELRALQCAVIDQNKINNEVVRAAGEVRSALLLLKQNLDKPQAASDSTGRITEEMSRALGNINNALTAIALVRAKIEEDSIKGERKC